MSRKIIRTDAAPRPGGPYSQAVVVERTIFVSGQLGFDPATMKLEQTFQGQCHLALTNIRAIVEAAGAKLRDVVKTTVLLSDIENFAEMNKIYEQYFKEGEYPTRICYQVARLPKDAFIEIEAVAMLDK